MLRLPHKIREYNDLKTLWTFLEQIDRGYTPDAEEQAVLDSLESIFAFDEEWITTVPHSIALLHNIRFLDFGLIGITDCSPLADLTFLTKLYLSDTQITDCRPLAGLTSLTELDLSGTQITDCRPLAGLTSLTVLSLSGTQITDCSPLAGLTSLTELYLSNTQITECGPLAALSKVKTLDLRGLHLHSLPKEFLSLGIPFVDKRDRLSDGIYLRNVQLSTQPVSLFFQPREMIQAYFDSPKVPVQEAKVIFLGDGGAGKTYTVKRIHNDCKYEDYETDVTKGVDITPIDTGLNGEPLKINLWDFGGQEIMHSMHRCFLTERSLYVVILSNRTDLMSSARYWLKNIASFARNAPVLLAVNRYNNMDNGALDMVRLQKDYPNLRPQPLYYFAKDKEDAHFRRFLEDILEEAKKLDSCTMELPEKWEKIRTELLNAPKTDHESGYYISSKTYLDLCKKHNLDDPSICRWLLDWFNDLGVCFSYGDPDGDLSSCNVLAPRWLTNAVYYLIHKGKEFAENGRISTLRIEKLLGRPDPEIALLPDVAYEEHEVPYILRIMEKAKLAYQIDSEHEFIPALCRENVPENLHPVDHKKKLSYIMKYDYLPDTVVHRLMIQYYKDLHRDFTWRKGMRLSNRLTGLEAVVEMCEDNSTLRIDIYATLEDAPWKLLHALRKDLLKINQDIGIHAEEQILLSTKNEEVLIPLKHLLLAKEEHISELPIFSKDAFEGYYSVNGLLGETFGESIVKNAIEEAKTKKQSLVNNFNYYIINSLNKYNSTEGLENLLNTIWNMQTENNNTMYRFMELLLTQQAQSQEAIANAIRAALENSSDAESKEICEKLKPIKESKTFLQKVADFMKPVKTVGDGIATMYAGTKFIKTVYDAVSPWLIENLDKIPEILEMLKNLIRH